MLERVSKPLGVAALVLSAAVIIWIGAGCGGGEQGKGSDTAGKAGAEGSGAGASANRAPVARFEAFPIVGYEGMTAVRFDASLSSDDSTSSADLLKRWDYDGDGHWDGEALTAPRMRHIYEKAGEYRPRLMVIDAGGLVDSTVGDVIAIKRPCPAPDFTLADMNPNSKTYRQEISLSGLRGHRVLVWYGTPSG